MDKRDEYHRNAADAQREADGAIGEMDRAAWLRVAAGWLSLLRKRAPSAQERFDQEVSEKETGQEGNKSSN